MNLIVVLPLVLLLLFVNRIEPLLTSFVNLKGPFWLFTDLSVFVLFENLIGSRLLLLLLFLISLLELIWFVNLIKLLPVVLIVSLLLLLLVFVLLLLLFVVLLKNEAILSRGN